MTTLPARPDLGQLRRQAKDLLHAAQAADPAAVARIQAVSGRMTLAGAQLAVAREHGYRSWPRLKAEVEARTSDLAAKAEAFLEASIRDWTGRAVQMLAACLHADEAGARRQLARAPGLLARLTDAERGAIVTAAETGSTAAVTLMLDLGFPVEARGGDHGGTALHAAAYSGSVGTVRLLLDRGADTEARDSTWDDTPLGWAAVGSGIRPGENPEPDWVATVLALIVAGASTAGLTLSPDDPKPPSPEVAQLLREYGVGGG